LDLKKDKNTTKMVEEYDENQYNESTTALYDYNKNPTSIQSL
jgi:hypothetical protein